MQRVVAIVQARMGSRRLPGKVLRPLAGRPLIARVVERLRCSGRLDDVVVAIPTGPEDDSLAAVAGELHANVVRGPNQDTLRRYALAIEQTQADVVVRVTADCPLVDPSTVDRAIARFVDGDVDCVSVSPEGGFPLGLDAEVVGGRHARRARPIGIGRPSARACDPGHRSTRARLPRRPAASA